MSKEFAPDFTKWFTRIGTEAINHGQSDTVEPNQRRGGRVQSDGTYVESTLIGEGGKRVKKTDISNNEHVFRYMGRLNLYGSQEHSEFLFTDDGRIWVHTSKLDPVQTTQRGFADLSDAVRLLETAVTDV